MMKTLMALWLVLLKTLANKPEKRDDVVVIVSRPHGPPPPPYVW
jgi:hypothetical protein